jgi:hypothetical protein
MLLWILSTLLSCGRCGNTGITWSLMVFCGQTLNRFGESSWSQFKDERWKIMLHDQNWREWRTSAVSWSTTCRLLVSPLSGLWLKPNQNLLGSSPADILGALKITDDDSGYLSSHLRCTTICGSKMLSPALPVDPGCCSPALAKPLNHPGAVDSGTRHTSKLCSGDRKISSVALFFSPAPWECSLSFSWTCSVFMFSVSPERH